MLIRSAASGDELAVARVHVRSWQTAYRTLLPDDVLDRLRPEDRAKRYTFGSSEPQRPATIVAVDGASICGFATIAPARDADAAGNGELCALYVDPESWGRGVGVELISTARARLVDRGFQHATLWVLVGNIRAERFYQKDGWAPDGSRRTSRIWGANVEEVRYVRRLRVCGR